MEEVKDIDLENKEPNPTVPLPRAENKKKLEVAIHCAETRLLLQCISIGIGLATFGLLLWIVKK